MIPMDHGPFENVWIPEGSGPHACPCCGHLTLDGRGNYDTCPVCFWDDDGQDEHDADRVRGSTPNHGLSLAQARVNYAEIGACARAVLPHVRPPTDDEHQRR